MNTLLLTAMTVLPLVGSSDHEAGEMDPPFEGEITVTILFDNTAADDRLETGWGYAALLETPEHTVLFDTGADGVALLRNLRLLDKDPLAIDAVIISHAHGDHTGGLQALFDLGLRPTLYLLEAFPAQLREQSGISIQVVEASAGQEIVPGIRTTGQVGTAIPEQALVLETQRGTVVLTGCAHPGVIQMVERAAGLSSHPLHLVMGGFHLMEASPEEIQGILGEFRRLGVQRVGATHCSGDLAMTTFQNVYGDDFQPLGAGRVLKFPLSPSP